MTDPILAGSIRAHDSGLLVRELIVNADRDGCHLKMVMPLAYYGLPKHFSDASVKPTATLTASLNYFTPGGVWSAEYSTVLNAPPLEGFDVHVGSTEAYDPKAFVNTAPNMQWVTRSYVMTTAMDLMNKAFQDFVVVKALPERTDILCKLAEEMYSERPFIAQQGSEFVALFKDPETIMVHAGSDRIHLFRSKPQALSYGSQLIDMAALAW